MSFETFSYIVLAIVTCLSGLLGLWIKTIYAQEKIKKIEELLWLKRDIIKRIIIAIQQMYEDYDGDKKLELALIWIAEELTANGIKTTEKEVRSLLESILKELKVQFGDQWKSIGGQ